MSPLDSSMHPAEFALWVGAVVALALWALSFAARRHRDAWRKKERERVNESAANARLAMRARLLEDELRRETLRSNILAGEVAGAKADLGVARTQGESA